MYFEVTEAQQRREKAKARELRVSRWWQTVAARARCYYCAKELQKSEVTMDHIVPISQGGLSTKGNVVPACKSCNTLKRDMTAAEWALHCERLRLASAAGPTELHEVGEHGQE